MVVRIHSLGTYILHGDLLREDAYPKRRRLTHRLRKGPLDSLEHQSEPYDQYQTKPFQ